MEQLDPKLKAALAQLVPEDMLDMAGSLFEPYSAKKGEQLLRPGEVCHYSYLLFKGSIKMSYFKDGKEHIGDFHTEGEFASDHSSVLTGKPSHFYLTCLENSEILRVDQRHVNGLQEEHPFTFESLRRKIAEENFVIFADRIWSSLIDSPEDRYKKLLEEKPHWIQRFPQYMIASYLGLTPEGLSKIRKRMSS